MVVNLFALISNRYYSKNYLLILKILFNFFKCHYYFGYLEAVKVDMLLYLR